jgi:ribosomal protein S18 acetylase RimI-like enzyme
LLDCKHIELSNITIEELELFWNQLTAEKKYLGNPLTSNLTFAVGIRQNDEIVGIGGLKRYFGTFHFSFGIVKTEFQGKGFGSAIYDETFKYARSKSYPVILNSTNIGNIASLKASHKQGFKILHQSDSYCRMGAPLNTFGKIVIVILPILFSCYFLAQKILRKKEIPEDSLVCSEEHFIRAK